MLKLKALRQFLLESVPELKKNPERLLTFIEGGAIEFRRGMSLTHAYDMPCKLVITDYAGAIDALIIPLLQWISHYETNLKPDAVRFEAEILSNESYDIAITLPLCERVTATVDTVTGRIEAEHRSVEYPIDPASPDNWQLFLRNPGQGEEDYLLLAEWDNRPDL